MTDTTTTEMAITDPVAHAKSLWTDILAWQPALAAALAVRVRALPEDWTLHIFECGRADAALKLTPGASHRGITDHAPEVAPWQGDMDECDACAEAEAEGMCRYHQGYIAGRTPLLRMLRQVVESNPEMTVKTLLDRYIAEQAAAAK